MKRISVGLIAPCLSALLLAGTANMNMANATGALPATVASGTTTLVSVRNDIHAALTPQVVYTVPSGWTFVLTDMIFTSYQNVNCDIYVEGGSTVTSEFRIPPNQSLIVNLKTGLQFASNTAVYLVTDERLPGDNACTPAFTLTGVITKN